MTNAVVLSAPPTVGHSINPTSSAAPAKTFAPSSALASFAARIAAPMSSEDDDEEDDETSPSLALALVSSAAALVASADSDAVDGSSPSPLARATTTTARGRATRHADDARGLASAIDGADAWGRTRMFDARTSVWIDERLRRG